MSILLGILSVLKVIGIIIVTIIAIVVLLFAIVGFDYCLISSKSDEPGKFVNLLNDPDEYIIIKKHVYKIEDE